MADNRKEFRRLEESVSEYRDNIEKYKKENFA